MIIITQTQGDLGALAAGLRENAGSFQSRLVAALGSGLFEVQRLAKIYVPVQTHTLQRSLSVAVNRGTSDVVGYVGTNVPYARIQELGGYTGKNYKAFIKPKLYLESAVDESRDYIRERFKKLVVMNQR